jgi:hypothetical protein
MRHAGHLFDASRSVRFIIPSIGVRMSKALVGREMLTGMFSPSAGGELVPHRGVYSAGPSIFFSGLDPQPCGFSLVLTTAIALLEQLDRCIIHEDRLRLKHMIADRI